MSHVSQLGRHRVMPQANGKARIFGWDTSIFLCGLGVPEDFWLSSQLPTPESP